MVSLTFEEIEQYRAELGSNPAAMKALSVIADCEGDLEDAAITLALQAGQEPSESDRWLESTAKRWRVFLCQSDRRELLEGGRLSEAVTALVTETNLPSTLALPVILFVLKTGVENFCKPLEEKL